MARLNIHVSDELHARAKALAKMRGVSLSALVREAVERFVTTYDKAKPKRSTR